MVEANYRDPDSFPDRSAILLIYLAERGTSSVNVSCRLSVCLGSYSFVAWVFLACIYRTLFRGSPLPIGHYFLFVVIRCLARSPASCPVCLLLCICRVWLLVTRIFWECIVHHVLTFVVCCVFHVSRTHLLTRNKNLKRAMQCV